MGRKEETGQEEGKERDEVSSSSHCLENAELGPEMAFCIFTSACFLLFEVIEYFLNLPHNFMNS